MNPWYTVILSLLGTGAGTVVVKAIVERRKTGADVYATATGAQMQFVDRLEANAASLSKRLDLALIRIDEMELREDERDAREAIKDQALHAYAVWAQQVTQALSKLDTHPPIPPPPRSPLERS